MSIRNGKSSVRGLQEGIGKARRCPLLMRGEFLDTMPASDGRYMVGMSSSDSVRGERRRRSVTKLSVSVEERSRRKAVDLMKELDYGILSNRRILPEI